MDLWIAVVLGVVEGLTEYLPVSSTGHLIIVGNLLGLAETEANKAFEVVIQLGAILAVVVHYRQLLAQRAAGLFRGSPESKRLAIALLVAFVPVVVVGALFGKLVKHHLFGTLPVAIALVVGGLGMIVVERLVARRRPKITAVEEIGPRDALIVGLTQCLALWPGTSRSMSTILGGRGVGMTSTVAAEFSFLLAIPVLGAACAHDLLKNGKALLATSEARLALAIGFVVSFVVAWAVIAAFLQFLRRWSLAVFGYYRIVVGVLLLVFLRGH